MHSILTIARSALEYVALDQFNPFIDNDGSIESSVATDMKKFQFSDCRETTSETFEASLQSCHPSNLAESDWGGTPWAKATPNLVGWSNH